jgi:hypothetical protein
MSKGEHSDFTTKLGVCSAYLRISGISYVPKDRYTDSRVRDLGNSFNWRSLTATYTLPYLI